MGVFDLFGKNSKTDSSSTIKERNFSLDSLKEDSAKQPPAFSVFKPTKYSDVETIIDNLKEGKSTIVHLDEIKKECAIRIIDMLSGAVYALGGGVYEMQKNIFLFSPSVVEVN